VIIKRSKNRTFTYIEFINKSNEVHSKKYNYSKVNYINSQTKVIITCKEHGDFEQMPNSHLQGRGCEKCAIINSKEKQIFSVQEFINNAKEIHGNLYDYSNVIYTGANDKVIIVCKMHGSFNQNPSKHINAKQGCIKCSGRFKLTNEDFVKRAKDFYGDLYDYSKCIYVNCDTKVNIICKKHGLFEKTPYKHLQEQGCPKCSINNYSKSSIKYLDFISKYNNIQIQHAENVGEHIIKTTNYSADGYCEETNTIYEYHGDFWHGNPNLYKTYDINKRNGKTFGELYKKTLEREQQIRDFGYNLVVMWEHEWNKINKSIRTLQRKFKSLH